MKHETAAGWHFLHFFFFSIPSSLRNSTLKPMFERKKALIWQRKYVFIHSWGISRSVSILFSARLLTYISTYCISPHAVQKEHAHNNTHNILFTVSSACEEFHQVMPHQTHSWLWYLLPIRENRGNLQSKAACTAIWCPGLSDNTRPVGEQRVVTSHQGQYSNTDRMYIWLMIIWSFSLSLSEDA